MRKVLATYVVLGALVPVGCAASISSTPSPPSTARTQPVRYVALGDSYTVGTSVGTEERWPNQLVTALGERVPIELAANLGVNGYTTADLIREELPELADLQPDLVTLQIGVNDVVRGRSIDEYRANVRQILGSVLEVVPRERIVVVATPDYTRSPRGADYGEPAQQRAEIAAFNGAMQDMAEERGIAFVDITPVADRVGSDASLVASDKLHPSGEQYRRWVELIAPVVEELLE